MERSLLKSESIRRHVALVPQDPVLFPGTIYYNILIGNLSAPNETVIKSAYTAKVHKYIMSLPEGYGTQVTNNIPAEYRRRITLARALLHNPSVLLLDEASAAEQLCESEYLPGVFENNRTTIIVTRNFEML